MSLEIIIMAAGKGTRMKSNRPKVLHQLGGHALLAHVLKTCQLLHAQQIYVVTGHGAEAVEAACRADFPTLPLNFVRQDPQLGTGHAVQQAAPLLAATGTTLILNGDVPLIRPATALALIQTCHAQNLALLTIELADPTGYGRIVRHTTPAATGAILGIVEHKDATPSQQQIREVYTGMMAAPTALLRRWVNQLNNHNAQGEYYLTDIVAMAQQEQVHIQATAASQAIEVLGVNSPSQLAQLERLFQAQQAEQLMEQGVRLADPARFDLRGAIHVGQDVEIDINNIFAGHVELGDRVRIGAHCFIKNARIASDTVIHPYSHIEGASATEPVVIGAHAIIGPFARLRPGAQLAAEVHIGNFVEVKNTTMAQGAKANHLAYLGDATVGERVNYGAGAITANYDGVHKHRTILGNDVHIGSNCVLVAPIQVGAGATIGAGSTISTDAPAAALTVARPRAVTLARWQRPKKAPETGSD